MPHTSVLNEQTHGPTPQDDRVDARLLVRLYASKHTHRLMPAFLALAISAALGPPAGKRRNPYVERDAVRFMKDLLLYTPRASEAEALARRYRREHARMIELLWRPWLFKRSRVIGKEHWDAAHAGEGGCVATIGHMGGTWAVAPILGRHGLHVHMVASPHYWQREFGGLLGLATLHMDREYGEKALGSGRLIPSNARPERLIELVESGETVLNAWDVPGSSATPFLGRSVALGGGSATIAFRTGAKVLPMIPERHGSRIDLRMLEPLDPADYRDRRSLRAAIARTFEPLVLAKPEILEIPWFPPPLVTEATSTLPPEYAATMRRLGVDLNAHG